MDAASHFIEDGRTVDCIPLEDAIGPVTLVDFSDLGPNGKVTEEMVCPLPQSRRMVIRYGWSGFWPDAGRYYSDWPHISPGAARMLIKKGVRMLGYDTCSPDDPHGPIDGGPRDSPIHKMFLGAGVTLLEYLANLERIPDFDGWNIAALPLRLEGADGAPARVVLFR